MTTRRDLINPTNANRLCALVSLDTTLVDHEEESTPMNTLVHVFEVDPEDPRVYCSIFIERLEESEIHEPSGHSFNDVIYCYVPVGALVVDASYAQVSAYRNYVLGSGDFEKIGNSRTMLLYGDRPQVLHPICKYYTTVMPIGKKPDNVAQSKYWSFSNWPAQRPGCSAPDNTPAELPYAVCGREGAMGSCPMAATEDPSYKVDNKDDTWYLFKGRVSSGRPTWWLFHEGESAFEQSTMIDGDVTNADEARSAFTEAMSSKGVTGLNEDDILITSCEVETPSPSSFFDRLVTAS